MGSEGVGTSHFIGELLEKYHRWHGNEYFKYCHASYKDPNWPISQEEYEANLKREIETINSEN